MGNPLKRPKVDRSAQREQARIIAQQNALLKKQREEAEAEKAKLDAEIARKEDLRKRRLMGRRSLISGSELGENEKLG